MTSNLFVPRGSFVFLAFGAGILLCVSGCGGGQAEVSGKVTYKGAPVPGGLVTFRPADARKNAVTAELDQEGTYRATLPSGEVTVTIDNRELAPTSDISDAATLNVPISAEAKKALGRTEKRVAGAARSGARRSERYVEIPVKYHEAETTDLKFTVGRGSQKQDLTLKD
jgi:hypothetical protein